MSLHDWQLSTWTVGASQHGNIPAVTWTFGGESLYPRAGNRSRSTPQEEWYGESFSPGINLTSNAIWNYVTSARVSKTWWWKYTSTAREPPAAESKQDGQNIKIIYMPANTYKHRSNKARSRLVWTSIRPTDTMTWQRLAAVLVSLYITSLTRRVSCCTGNSAILVYCQGAAFTPVAKLSAW